jgi:hypothetical protein
MISRSEITKWIVRGVIGLGFGYLATSVLGLRPMITVNFGGWGNQPPAHAGRPYDGDARRGPGKGYRDHGDRRSEDTRMDDILRGEARSPGRR